MKVLILGSSGREHALAWKAAQSPRLKKLFCAPGSSAISELAECVPLAILDGRAVADFCKAKEIDLVLIGPEAPLAVGVADALRKAGIKTFGPGRQAARLESSKSFAKEFLKRHAIPTASWKVFAKPEEARAAVRTMRPPLVVKADGLASGKGVRVCRGTGEALQAVADFMEKKTLGQSGRTVVIEEYLEGPELSVMMLCDGKTFKLLPLSRDHKRLKDGDLGPNTGGMGAYAPVSLDERMQGMLKREVLDRVLAGLAQDKLAYQGVLYIGLMLTADGPKVLEFNCRFGDPETQAVLPLLKSDLLDLALACVEGRLDSMKIETRPGACVCVTMASAGYPERPVSGRKIEGLDALPNNSSSLPVFHAGTKHEGKDWLTAGGRVLGVAAIGSGLEEARDKAYQAAAKIKFQGMQYRADIAAKAPTLSKKPTRFEAMRPSREVIHFTSAGRSDVDKSVKTPKGTRK